MQNSQKTLGQFNPLKTAKINCLEDLLNPSLHFFEKLLENFHDRTHFSKDWQCVLATPQHIFSKDSN